MRSRGLGGLSDIGDALWGGADDPLQPASGSALVMYFGVAAAIALLLVMRRIDGITNPQFWAEDGSVFFQKNLKLGCWHALHVYFRGFPYVGQKLVACAATPFPIVHVPMVYNLVAYAVAAATLASFSLPGFRHVVRSNALRGVFGLAVAALPQATELVGSLTNIGWYLGIWLTLLPLMRLPRSLIRLVALAVACLLATFSAPLSVMTAPVWLARAVHALRRRHLREACFATVALCSVFALLWYAGDLGRDPGAPRALARPFLESLSLLVLAHAALGPGTVLGLFTRFGPGIVYAVAVALLVVLAALARRARWRSLPVVLYCAYGIVVSSALPLVGHPGLAGMASTLGALVAWLPLFPGRYHVPAVSLVYLAFLASTDHLPTVRSRSIAAGVLLTWIAITEAATFVLPPFYDLQWPSYAARLEQKLAARHLEPLIIPINPDRVGYTFNIALDARATAPEVSVPADTKLGPVLSTTTYEQSFVARCPDLSEIDLFFGKKGRAAAQTVEVRIREQATGRVVASVVRETSVIVSPIEAFVSQLKRITSRGRVSIPNHDARALRSFHPIHALYFPRIRDSEGKRYVITVTGSGGAPDDALILFGSAADTYHDGEARLNGESLPGDLAFRYACSRP